MCFVIMFQGHVDPSGEINKCEKLTLVKMNLLKIEKSKSQADYETAVPENIRLANDEKVYQAKVAFFSIADFFWQRKTHEADIKLLEHSIGMGARTKQPSCPGCRIQQYNSTSFTRKCQLHRRKPCLISNCLTCFPVWVEYLDCQDSHHGI